MNDASFASGFEHPICRRTRGQRIFHGILWGGVVAGAGVLFLLEHLGHLGQYQAWSFWPIVLLVAGLELMTRRFRRLFGVALAATGGLLLVHSLALAPLEWGMVWPVLVIGLGLLLIAKVFTRSRAQSHVHAHPHPCSRLGGDLPPGAVVMGSKEDRIDSQAYEGGHVSTVMGSYVLDLTRAEILGDRATVVAKAVMGGIEIRTPPHWKVEVRARPVMGGVENKTREPDSPTKTLVIEAEAVLGGIEIRN